MEEGVRLDPHGVCHKSNALRIERLLKLIEVLEATVLDGFIAELPKVLGWLHFGGVGVDDDDALGGLQGRAGMPGCSIHEQQDASIV